MDINFTLSRVIQCLSSNWWETKAGRDIKAAMDAQNKAHGPDAGLWSDEAKRSFIITIRGIDW